MRPAFAWFLRRVVGVTLTNVTLGIYHDDQRPAIVLDGGADVTFDEVCAQRGSGSQWDVVLRGHSTAKLLRPGVGCPPLRIQPPTRAVPIHLTHLNDTYPK